MIGAATATECGPVIFCAGAATLRTAARDVAATAAAFARGFTAAFLCVLLALRCLRLAGTVPLIPSEATRWSTIMNVKYR